MRTNKLELLAQLRGVSVEELRKQFSDMGKRSLTPERAKEIQKKSVEARRRNREEKERS